jgi:hypothetical protein
MYQIWFICFLQAVVFNQPLNSWDTSTVTNMYGMFYGTVEFNRPLNDWDVTNVTDMTYMFLDAYSFDHI